MHNMKKLAAFAAAGSLALALSGCSSLSSGIANFGNSVAGAINNVSTAASSPAATQAAANLKAGMTALVCYVGDVSALTNQIATQIGAGHALIMDSANVYVISANTCTALGGSVVGNGTIPSK